jgi:RNA polymerase sigma factor (sigma-70 family)
VSIPTSHGSYTVSHAMSKDKTIDTIDGITEATLLSLTQAMSNLTESATEDTAFTVDHAILYEQTDYYQHIMSVAKKTLSTTEIKILQLRYFGDMTQDEVAEHMKLNQKLVSRHEISALNKLKKQLVTIRDV